MSREQVILRVLLKTGTGIDFHHTHDEATRFVKQWTEKVENTGGITIDGVSWAIRIDAIAGMLIVPYTPPQQKTIPSPGRIGQAPMYVGMS